jgi:hypothetical protein
LPVHSFNDPVGLFRNVFYTALLIQ